MFGSAGVCSPSSRPSVLTVLAVLPGFSKGGDRWSVLSLSLGSDLGLKSPPPALDASGLAELLLALPAAVAVR